MTRSICWLPLALLGWAAFLSPSAPARAEAPATQPTKFIRFVDRGPDGGELDTADVAYADARGATVHLIAAVHIGERAYYERLARDFDGYDALLYELIMSKDAAPPAGNGAGENSDTFVSRLQILLKRSLDLEFQLDVIDYTKPNFVHADLDKETFEKLQAERGESLWTLMLQAAMSAWANPPPEVAADPREQLRELTDLLCRPDGQRQFKLLIARQMDELDAVASGLGGPDGSVILTERNKAAIAVLDNVLAQGKTKIAIFYGAAHMPDLARQLAARGFKPVDVQWRMAWDMTIRPSEPSTAQRLLDEMIDAIGGGN